MRNLIRMYGGKMQGNQIVYRLFTQSLLGSLLVKVIVTEEQIAREMDLVNHFIQRQQLMLKAFCSNTQVYHYKCGKWLWVQKQEVLDHIGHSVRLLNYLYSLAEGERNPLTKPSCLNQMVQKYGILNNLFELISRQAKDTEKMSEHTLMSIMTLFFWQNHTQDLLPKDTVQKLVQALETISLPRDYLDIVRILRLVCTLMDQPAALPDAVLKQLLRSFFTVFIDSKYAIAYSAADAAELAEQFTVLVRKSELVQLQSKEYCLQLCAHFNSVSGEFLRLMQAPPAPDQPRGLDSASKYSLQDLPLFSQQVLNFFQFLIRLHARGSGICVVNSKLIKELLSAEMQEQVLALLEHPVHSLTDISIHRKIVDCAKIMFHEVFFTDGLQAHRSYQLKIAALAQSIASRLSIFSNLFEIDLNEGFCRHKYLALKLLTDSHLFITDFMDLLRGATHAAGFAYQFVDLALQLNHANALIQIEATFYPRAVKRNLISPAASVPGDCRVLSALCNCPPPRRYAATRR